MKGGMGEGKKRAGRAVVRKVGGAYELSERRENADDVEDRMIRGGKRKTAKERVPFIQRSRRKRQRQRPGVAGGAAGCGGWLEMNRFTHRE